MLAEDRWNSEVKKLVDRGVPQAAAIRRVVAELPQVHAAYIREVNAAVGRPAGRFATIGGR